MTVFDLIKRALRLIGQLGPGRGPGAAELADAFLVLNSMIEQWNNERLNIFQIRVDTYPLTGLQQTYTIGPGAADFNTDRPARIERATVLILNNPAQPLELPMELLTFDGWKRIPIKAIQASFPLKVYYDLAFPIGNLNFWPIPTVVNDFNLYTWQQLAQFAGTADTVSFPPGYQDAIAYNLAVKLAPEWGKPLRADVAAEAIRLKNSLKRMNVVVNELTCDPAIISTRKAYNWITDNN